MRVEGSKSLERGRSPNGKDLLRRAAHAAWVE